MLETMIDLVSSDVYPGLDRKPGISNWVDKAGGLPKYIERIAKHLHYEQGMSISRAIATAVNTVKRWARMGKVAKYGDPHHKHVTAATAAKAAAAVAEWYAKRAAGKLHLTEAEFIAIELCEVTDEFALDLAEEMGFVIDLADADIEKSDTMIALMLPPKVAKKLAIDGGVPPGDMHITLTFHGETTPAQYAAICADLKAWAADGGPGELSGHVGGLGQFPAQDAAQGTPHYVPADVPGISQLHEQVKAVTSKSAPASEDHGFTPHSTLTYTKKGEAPPSPVPKTPVKFKAIHVVRGNRQRTKIPLQPRTGVLLSQHATLRVGDIDLTQGTMDIQPLVDRANAIEDPVARAEVRQKVLDLAVARSKLTVDKRKVYAKNGTAMSDGKFPVFDATSLRSAIGLARTPAQRAHICKRAKALGLDSMIPDSWPNYSLAEAVIRDLIDLASTIAPLHARGRVTDGRRSYKGQGKFKHGFIPVDEAAKEAKAKGSPIAIKRLNRLYGGAKAKAAAAVKGKGGTPGKGTPAPARVPGSPGKGRAGQRTANQRKRNPTSVTIKEKSQPGSESASSLANLRNTDFTKGNRSDKPGLPTSQKEASKSTRIPTRAKQNWDEIPANLKTVRNGKRYVYSEFGKGGFVTPWVGGVQGVAGTAPDKAKVMASITPEDAAKLSPGDARAMLLNPKTPASVRKAIRKATKDRLAAPKHG